LPLPFCGEADFQRIGALLTRFTDLKLDAAEASVVVCVESNRCPAVTTDREEFDVIGKRTGLVVLPAYA
jgi:hypothetical protein